MFFPQHHRWLERSHGACLRGHHYRRGEGGGIHGDNRLGGNSLLDCVIFGRVAGKAACKCACGDVDKFKPCPTPNEIKEEIVARARQDWSSQSAGKSNGFRSDHAFTAEFLLFYLDLWRGGMVSIFEMLKIFVDLFVIRKMSPLVLTKGTMPAFPK
ncbi:osm1 [Symbiodinium sp. CCMP2592]|nr:osm1 [Symbiodinium sp. CCMP2592]